MKTKLTIQQQVEVLRGINWDSVMDYNEYGVGVCWGIFDSYRRVIEVGLSVEQYMELLDPIPLFSLDNAVKFGASRGSSYWWLRNEWGYNKRKEFVSWIISELEKHLNK